LEATVNIIILEWIARKKNLSLLNFSTIIISIPMFWGKF